MLAEECATVFPAPLLSCEAGIFLLREGWLCCCCVSNGKNEFIAEGVHVHVCLCVCVMFAGERAPTDPAATLSNHTAGW